MLDYDSRPHTGGKFLINGGLFATAAFASVMPATCREYDPSIIPSSALFFEQQATPLSIHPSLTNPTHLAIDFLAEAVSSTMDESHEVTYFRDDEWVKEFDRSQPWRTTMSQFAEITSFRDGWHGQGSEAAKELTVDTARAALSMLEEMTSEDAAPMVGLDRDGFIVLSWSKGTLQGNMSIFDDGTYAYYIKKDGISASAADRSLVDLAPDEIVNILNA